MKFPKRQADIIALATNMIVGYWNYYSDFPHVNRMKLNTKFQSLNTAIKKLADAKATQRMAQSAADAKLKLLKGVMRDCLKKSTVDVAGEPQKLKFIGWAPKADSHKANIPNQPTVLQAVAKDNAAVQLSWCRPAERQRVLNYIIERREQTNISFTKWQTIANSFKTQITLTNQLTGVMLEYRIRAANNAGKSRPGNSAEIIL